MQDSLILLSVKLKVLYHTVLKKMYIFLESYWAVVWELPENCLASHAAPTCENYTMCRSMLWLFILIRY
jgi:hypothetical protein